MTHATLEHINITVADPRRSAAMLEALFGWTVRWEGAAQRGGLTVHVGGDDQYLALWGDESGNGLKHVKGAPLNHVGVVVDDLAATEARVKALGLEPFAHGDYAPGRRFYFFDENQIEYEVVSYTSSESPGA